MEGNACRLIRGTVQTFSWKSWGNPRRSCVPTDNRWSAPAQFFSHFKRCMHRASSYSTYVNQQDAQNSCYSFCLLGIDQFDLLKPSGFFPYQQGLTFKNSTWCSLCVECFVRTSEQTATFALNFINWLVFVTVVESVYCAVRIDSLYKADYVSSLKG